MLSAVSVAATHTRMFMYDRLSIDRLAWSNNALQVAYDGLAVDKLARPLLGNLPVRSLMQKVEPHRVNEVA